MTDSNAKATAQMRLSLAEVNELSHQALLNSKTSRQNAASVADSITKAEADGMRSIGLGYLPTFCQHARCGKVDGMACPQLVQLAPASLLVDAKTGFAHPAISLGLNPLAKCAALNGIAALAITNSYACGVVGHLVEPLARQGLLALAFANSPANIAPWGGSDPLFGTNPLAVAVPRKDHDPMIIDQSSSVVTKVALLEKAAQDLPLPKGWAFDRQGKSTIDAQEALQGSMAPAGGYKGVGIALLVEIMAAGLTGANWSFLASSFGNDEGGPPRTGQFLVAVNCSAFGENRFLERLEALCSRILNQEGTRLPGDRRWGFRARAEQEGIYVEKELIEKIESFCP